MAHRQERVSGRPDKRTCQSESRTSPNPIAASDEPMAWDEPSITFPLPIQDFDTERQFADSDRVINSSRSRGHDSCAQESLAGTTETATEPSDRSRNSEKYDMEGPGESDDHGK